MDLFTVDTAGEAESLIQLPELNIKIEESNGDEEEPINNNDIETDDIDYGGIASPNVDVIAALKKAFMCNKPLYESPKVTKKDDTTIELQNFSKLMGWDWDDILPKKPIISERKATNQRHCLDFDEFYRQPKTNVNKEMEDSVLKGIEQQTSVEKLSKNKLGAIKKAESTKTKGRNWFNIPATEVSGELRNELEIVQMRSALDPAHFYKKNDLIDLPKYFEIGTVLSSPLEPDANINNVKKETLVDQLLKDAEFQQYNKQKYKEVKAEKKKKSCKKQHKGKKKH